MKNSAPSFFLSLSACAYSYFIAGGNQITGTIPEALSGLDDLGYVKCVVPSSILQNTSS